MEDDEAGYEKTKDIFYNIWFPFLQILGILLSSGIFVFTPVEDRE